jgi:hypothetical protein
MKIISRIKAFEQKHINLTIFIGIAIGVGVGMYIFAWFVPGAPEMIKLYQLEKRAQHSMTHTNMRYDTNTMTSMPTMNVSSTIVDERQFLPAMIAHHEAALRMSHQVLGLVGVSDEVKALANSIIASQSGEINVMKNMLSVTLLPSNK